LKQSSTFDRGSTREDGEEKPNQLERVEHVGTTMAASLSDLGMSTSYPTRFQSSGPSESSEYGQCKDYLRQGPVLDAVEFAAWIGENNGAWIEEKDKHGYTLMHIGMWKKVPAKVVQLLIEAWPAGVRETDERYGYTPLYLGMEHNASAQVVQLLVAAWPDGAKAKTTYGNDTALHRGMQYNASAEAIQVLMEAWPEGALEKDGHGSTPLDYGVLGVPPEALAAHREGMSPAELCGSFLLGGPSLDVTESVAWFGANNDGEWIKEKDRDGNTLLHLGMWKKVPAAVIRLLVEAWPKGAEATDKEGRTPLQRGVITNVPCSLSLSPSLSLSVPPPPVCTL
jgi:hypothetical protein